MAAEAASAHGALVSVFDAMPSVGRKFLLAGKSGLNLTHTEPLERFMTRFGAARERIAPMLAEFGSEAIAAWAGELGIETFTGSSGRIFPVDFKAAPLLRAWIRRLRQAGVAFHVRHRWQGWSEDGAIIFQTKDGAREFRADATVLALGGGSWPKLGSDGVWAPLLAARGVAVNPLLAANCGFDVAWSPHFRSRFAGEPVKPAALTSVAGRLRGEFVISETGIEGGGVYPHSAWLRDEIAAHGSATLAIDLLPDRTPDFVAASLARPRGGKSLAEHLRRTLGLRGVKAGLLRECLPPEALADNAWLAAAIKALPLRLTAARPLAEAISSAGGVAWNALDETLMLRAMPGVYAAGEMLDWEAPTGGYLLTGCFATGRWAGRAAASGG
jgi:uncharacterized flavoprotein (TIGR03862 family)